MTNVRRLKRVKVMKKIASLVLAGAMTLSMSVAAFALTGVTAEEQKILDAAPAKAAELGVPTSSEQYQKYYSQAVTYVQQNDMTTTQVNGALKAMDDATVEAKTAMEKAGVSSLLDLDEATLKSLTASCATVINKELQAVGIEVRVSADGTVTGVTQGTKNPTSTDTPKQNTVISSTRVVKQTGSDMTATVVVAATVVGAVAACGVVSKKKGLFAKTEA